MSEAGHIRGSLGLLAAFMAIGLGLEALVGLRLSGWVDDPVRRELLRLGHAHGGVLALAGLAAGWAMRRLATPPAWAQRIRVALLLSALLVGLGFVGGGLWHGPADPGPVILLVPAGAFMAIAAIAAIAVVGPQPDPP